MPKKFWTYLETAKYNIGLTSRTVYVYDKNGNEQAIFKDLIYAYSGVISPNEELLAIKSTDGRIAIYSLVSLKLINKFRFSKVDGAQDDNLIFSPDNKFLLNIERHGSSLNTALSIYSTIDFSLKKRLFEEDDNVVLSFIEYDKESNNYYLLGALRDSKTRCTSKYFVSKLVNDKLEEIKYIDRMKCDFFVFAKRIEASGFTEESYKWLFFLKITPLNELKKMNLSLSNLWKSL